MISFSTNCRTVETISVWNSVSPRVWASLVMWIPSGDRSRVGQARDVSRRQPESLREDVDRVLTQRGRCRAGGMDAIEGRRHARRQIVADAGLMQPRKQWIGRYFRVFDHLRE